MAAPARSRKSGCSKNNLKPTMRSKAVTQKQTHFENPVKAQLKRGQPVFGVVITVNSVEVAAQVATLGVHFLWIEMEHAPNTFETPGNLALAPRGLPPAPLSPAPGHQP